MNAPSCLGGESWVQAQSTAKDLYVLLLSELADSEETLRRAPGRCSLGPWLVPSAWLGLTVWAGGQLTQASHLGSQDAYLKKTETIICMIVMLYICDTLL